MTGNLARRIGGGGGNTAALTVGHVLSNIEVQGEQCLTWMTS